MVGEDASPHQRSMRRVRGMCAASEDRRVQFFKASRKAASKKQATGCGRGGPGKSLATGAEERSGLTFGSSFICRMFGFVTILSQGSKLRSPVVSRSFGCK